MPWTFHLLLLLFKLIWNHNSKRFGLRSPLAVISGHLKSFQQGHRSPLLLDRRFCGNFTSFVIVNSIVYIFYLIFEMLKILIIFRFFGIFRICCEILYVFKIGFYEKFKIFKEIWICWNFLNLLKNFGFFKKI